MAQCAKRNAQPVQPAPERARDRRCANEGVGLRPPCNVTMQEVGEEIIVADRLP